MEKLENEIGITQLEADLMKKCKELEEENEDLKERKENLIRADKKKSDHIDELEEENKKLKEEIEQLKNKRVFNSEEYDLITLTSTIPQWELRKK